MKMPKHLMYTYVVRYKDKKAIVRDTNRNKAIIKISILWNVLPYRIKIRLMKKGEVIRLYKK